MSTHEGSWRWGILGRPSTEPALPFQSLREDFLSELSCRLFQADCGLDTNRLISPTVVYIDEEEVTRRLQVDNWQFKLPHFLVYCAPGTELGNPNGALRISATDVIVRESVVQNIFDTHGWHPEVELTATTKRGLQIDVEQIAPGSGTVKLSPAKKSDYAGESFIDAYDLLGGRIRRVHLENPEDPHNQDYPKVAVLIADKGSLAIVPFFAPAEWKRLFDQNGRFINEEKPRAQPVVTTRAEAKPAPPPPKAPEKPISEEQRLVDLIGNNPMEAWSEIKRKVASFPRYEGVLSLPAGTRSAALEGIRVLILQRENVDIFRTPVRIVHDIRFTLSLPPEQITRFLELCGNNQFADDQFRTIFGWGNQTERLFLDAKISFDDPEFPFGKLFLTARKGRWNGLEYVEESQQPARREFFAHFLSLLKPAEQRTFPESEPPTRRDTPVFDRTEHGQRHRPEILRGITWLPAPPDQFLPNVSAVSKPASPEPAKQSQRPKSSRERRATRRARLKAERKKGGERK